LSELFDQLRKANGSYSSYGIGAFGHLGAEMLLERAGVTALHVPYKAAAMNDLVAGLNTFAVTTVSEATPLIASGRLRALAVASPTRMPSLPAVPTGAESSSGKLNLSNFTLEVWYGLFAPANTPAAFISKLSNATIDALKRPEVQAKLTGASVAITPWPTPVFAKQIDADFLFWKETLDRLQAHSRLK
jgi:tripartite-type tricarboxylate transporter receptor subunit TctC